MPYEDRSTAVRSGNKKRISICLDTHIVEYFKKHPYDGSYQQAINWVLNNYIVCQNHFREFNYDKMIELLALYSLRIHELIDDGTYTPKEI